MEILDPGVAIGEPTWDDYWWVNYNVSVANSTSNRIDYHGVRNDATMNSGAGVGTKVSSGNLEGFVHNGSSETTTTLLSGFSTGPYNITIEFDPTGEVIWTVDGTQQGSVTSGLPTGTLLQFNAGGRVENTAAQVKKLEFNQFRVGAADDN